MSLNDAVPAAGPGAPMTRRSDLRHLLHALAIGLFLIAVIRTAWLSDDAFITLRTIDNLVSGYGPRWNVAERVQTYTHPLWMLLMTIPYAWTREAFFTPIVLSIALSGSTVWMLMARVAVSASMALVVAATVVFSKAFVDYSTSGLENPLTHLLLAAFILVFVRRSRGPDAARSLTLLWTLAGLLMLNRLDISLLVLPALGVRSFDSGWRPTWRAALAGLSPLVLWEMFSIVYYGFPFPNTAYAKLGVGVGATTLVGQGALYLLDSVAADPVTLLAIVGFTTAVCFARPKTSWPLALGILLYLAYVVRIGGDFMSGRFLTAPLVCAVANFARVDWRLPRFAAPVVSLSIATIFALLGLLATTRPPLTSGRDTFIRTPAEGLGVGGVADERAFYYRYTGLLRWTREQPLPYNAEVQWGREAAAAGTRVVVHANIGLYGLYAGPTVHIIDPFGLGDPLLARLPALPGWRIGHFERAVPDGYAQTIETGKDVIADTAIAMKYERLKLVTAGPLWSRRRWQAIAALNLHR